MEYYIPEILKTLKYKILFFLFKNFTNKLKIIKIKNSLLSTNKPLEVGDKITYLYPDWNSSQFRPWIILKRKELKNNNYKYRYIISF